MRLLRRAPTTCLRPPLPTQVFALFMLDAFIFQSTLDKSFAFIGDPADERQPARPSEPAAAAPASGGAGAPDEASPPPQGRRRESSVLSPPPPPPPSQSQGGTQPALKTYLYKSRSRLGPTASGAAPRGGAVASDRRFFVLQGRSLSWYPSDDSVLLEKPPLTTIDLRQYSCAPVEGAELMLALTAASPPAKKSWYVRAADRSTFDEWRRALGGATGPAGSAAPEVDSSGTSSRDARGVLL